MKKVLKKVRIIELRKKGLTINQIVSELGCAKSTVSFHINKEGLGGTINNFLLGIDDKTINKIIELRNENKTYLEILKIVNISEDKLKKVCRKYDINRSSTKFKDKIVNKDEILKYYQNGNSIKKTSQYFKLSRETVRKHIPDDMIKIREIVISKSKAVSLWRKRSKLRLIEYKGGKCEKCGYNKCTSAMHFLHNDPNEKDFTIGGKSFSLEKLKKEADKCILVCSNCHSEIHEGILKI